MATRERVVSPFQEMFGRVVRGNRHMHGFDAVAFGGMVNRAPSTVRRIERGTANPRLDALEGIARALDMPLSALFARAEELQAARLEEE